LGIFGITFDRIFAIDFHILKCKQYLKSSSFLKKCSSYLKDYSGRQPFYNRGPINVGQVLCGPFDYCSFIFLRQIMDE